MAKRLKAPIDFIINRVTDGKWSKDCEWSQEIFRTSVEQHPCDANDAVVKAMDGEDDEYLLFTIEHLIHVRCGYIPQCYEFVKKAREFDWRT